eukprot:TRINITY_DN24254_c0_g1_i1.p1 TRINITY_DN24254_c0_g1~~TRINITY_DN24254_c0_g1_i1.p1  ORF type:complete len:1145 (-),score=169.55 TRINITY_DN24254_c0_g1_i1:291-3725(-)
MSATVEQTTKSPVQKVGLSCITFGYGLPLMHVGNQRPLQASDLPPLLPADEAEVLVRRVQEGWLAELERHPKNPSLVRMLLRTFRLKVLLAAFWCFLESVVRIIQPVLLQYLMRALVADDDSADVYVYAAELTMASLVQAVVHHQLFFVTMTHGLSLRISMTGLLHWKLLQLRDCSVNSKSSADCYNLASNDCQRFDLALPFVQFGWAAIMDILAVAALLVLDVGWIPAASGLAVVLLFTAIMTSLGKYLLRRRQITAGITDKRLKLTSEILSAVMSIKIYCWEQVFAAKVAAIRQQEHTSIFKRQIRVSAISSMYFTVAPISTLVLFLTFIVQGRKLSLPVVYAVLGLLLVLRMSIGKGFAQFIKSTPEMLSALSRMQHFLMLPQAPQILEAVTSSASGPVLELTSASFNWPHGGSQAVSELSLQVNQAELVVVSGPVGCGKSALLQALLGELDIRAGSCKLSKVTGLGKPTVAYAPQRSWIFAGTLRENILLGADYEKDWYEQVILACCLQEDLSNLGPLGDFTEIGERGVNLSGGQCARVGLARAVYAKPDLLLLDDPLSAVDPAVSAKLVHNCIRADILQSSAVVLCTHQESVFPLATTLLMLGPGGSVRGCGPPHEVAKALGLGQLSASSEFANDSAAKSPAQDQQPAASSTAGTEAGSALVQPEDQRQSSVGWSTYLHFARLAGRMLTLLVVFLFLGSQVCLLFSNYWLGKWAEAEDQSTPIYMGVFAASTACTVVFACLRSVLFYLATLRASSSLHNRALNSILGTHLAFFTSNPHGRIMNRFSGDLGNIDELLSAAAHEVADLGFIMLGSVVLVSITVPPVIPFFFVMFYYQLRLRRFVVKSMTQLKRLDNISKSPVFDCFADTMRGLTCIRAFGRQEAAQRRITTALHQNNKAWFWWMITNRFIGFRLDMLSVLILGLAAFGGAALRRLISPELIGLAVVEAISLSGLLQFMVRQSALVESFMTSFDRLVEYCRLPAESDQGCEDLPTGFPAKGVLTVSKLCMRYREDLPEVLRDVDFSCPGGVKIGICGRTGSGKSSFFAALARLADVTSGSIAIDGVDTASMPLASLRSCISWVPQQPSFFSGSVRMNLDPCGHYADETIWQALKSVEMVEAISRTDGLNMQMESEGICQRRL